MKNLIVKRILLRLFILLIPAYLLTNCASTTPSKSPFIRAKNYYDTNCEIAYETVFNIYKTTNSEKDNTTFLIDVQKDMPKISVRFIKNNDRITVSLGKGQNFIGNEHQVLLDFEQSFFRKVDSLFKTCSPKIKTANLVEPTSIPKPNLTLKQFTSLDWEAKSAMWFNELTSHTPTQNYPLFDSTGPYSYSGTKAEFKNRFYKNDSILMGFHFHFNSPFFDSYFIIKEQEEDTIIIWHKTYYQGANTKHWGLISSDYLDSISKESYVLLKTTEHLMGSPHYRDENTYEHCLIESEIVYGKKHLEMGNANYCDDKTYSGYVLNNISNFAVKLFDPINTGLPDLERYDDKVKEAYALRILATNLHDLLAQSTKWQSNSD